MEFPYLVKLGTVQLYLVLKSFRTQLFKDAFDT